MQLATTRARKRRDIGRHRWPKLCMNWSQPPPAELAAAGGGGLSRVAFRVATGFCRRLRLLRGASVSRPAPGALPAGSSSPGPRRPGRSGARRDARGRSGASAKSLRPSPCVSPRSIHSAYSSSEVCHAPARLRPGSSPARIAWRRVDSGTPVSSSIFERRTGIWVKLLPLLLCKP